MRFSQLASAAIAATMMGAVDAKPTSPHQASGLNQAIKAHGKSFFGTAVTIRNDATERAIIDNPAEFGSVTPENAMKWEVVEPTRNSFSFSGADDVVALARSSGKQIHCHTLVWHSQLPAWVSEGNFDNATLINVMRNHIVNVAGRYKDVCTRWDVVNEALNENGTYRDSVFYRTIGEAFIPIAFRIASEVAPQAQLFYNDYNLESGAAKTAGALRIVKLVQSYGVKINGVGLQAHLASEVTATADQAAPSRDVLVNTLSSFTALGVDVAYTELDVRFTLPATPAKVQAQAKVFSDVVGSCLAVKRCVGITVWGVSDKYSWIPDVFDGEGSALLWDEDLRPKPAYYTTLQTLQSR